METNEKEYVPDGSGKVIINILDFEGNLVSRTYKNLSEIAVLENPTEEQ